jgi:hypothetical protein
LRRPFCWLAVVFAGSVQGTERPRIVGIANIYDKNFTRTEIMIRKPVETPCCSPNLDDFKQ